MKLVHGTLNSLPLCKDERTAQTLVRSFSCTQLVYFLAPKLRPAGSCTMILYQYFKGQGGRKKKALIFVNLDGFGILDPMLTFGSDVFIVF